MDDVYLLRICSCKCESVMCMYIYLFDLYPFFGNAMHFIWPNLASDLFSPPFVIITASEIVVKARTVIVCDCR